jgi:hypothetical protein
VPNACFLGVRRSPRRAPLHLPQSEGIGLVGFEPTACRRGDRSTVTCRARLYRVQFCNIARVALLRIGWQSFRYGSKPTAFHVSWPSTGRCCGGEYGLPNSRKNRRSVVRFSRCVTRNNKTPLIKIGLVGFEPTACRPWRPLYRKRISGWWDLNPRSPGPEPGAIPSFATARNDPEPFRTRSLLRVFCIR